MVLLNGFNVDCYFLYVLFDLLLPTLSAPYEVERWVRNLRNKWIGYAGFFVLAWLLDLVFSQSWRCLDIVDT